MIATLVLVNLGQYQIRPWILVLYLAYQPVCYMPISYSDERMRQVSVSNFQ